MTSGGAAALIRERVRRQGPIRFDEYLELALYAPGAGFYETGGRAGRDADFLTSPEVGPLFGAVLARALDSWWHALDEPDPYVVVEAGAGVGTLAAAVLAARPVCSAALRYVLVERASPLRDAHAGRVDIDPPAHVLGPVVAGPDGDLVPATGIGPVATSLAELPAGRFTGVVLANELLDNVPFRLFERRAGRWHELLVGDGDAFVLVDAPADIARALPDAPDGARAPVQQRATEWLRSALQLLDDGRVVIVDYADTTASLVTRPWSTWLRTYRRHGRAGGPLEVPGEQDVTVEVAVDQLARVRPPTLDRSQRDFLDAHGAEELIAAAQRAWEARAHIGDLEAIRHRSRVGEGSALRDPHGLGGFRVLEWVV